MVIILEYTIFCPTTDYSHTPMEPKELDRISMSVAPVLTCPGIWLIREWANLPGNTYDSSEG